MKLQIVPARNGLHWMRAGMRTFLRQPMALTGLFLIFMALMSLLAVVPYIGNLVALGMLPAATLGLMAATREAGGGRFPMPGILLSAFRAGRQELRAMLVLGALYALAILLLLGISASVDGGKFAHLYLFGGELSAEDLAGGRFEGAILLALLLYLPVSMLFWHAPALVHWHGVSPLKSLFFSFIACMRNFGAFTLYNLAWLLLIMALGTLLAIPAAFMDEPEMLSLVLLPLTLLMAAMYFSSILFTFEDCFLADGDVSPRAPGSSSLPLD